MNFRGHTDTLEQHISAPVGLRLLRRDFTPPYSFSHHALIPRHLIYLIGRNNESSAVAHMRHEIFILHEQDSRQRASERDPVIHSVLHEFFIAVINDPSPLFEQLFIGEIHIIDEIRKLAFEPVLESLDQYPACQLTVLVSSHSVADQCKKDFPAVCRSLKKPDAVLIALAMNADIRIQRLEKIHIISLRSKDGHR